MPNLKDRFARLTWLLMEQLLEVDSISESLTGSLEMLVRELHAQAGVIWIRDPKNDTLFPMFQAGTQDLSGVTVDIGIGTEGGAVQRGESILIADASKDPFYEGSIFEDQGIAVKSLLCVPLNDLKQVIGCLCLVNQENEAGFSEEELLFCERTAALDYATSIEVLQVIEQIVRERGTTVMMITHNPEIAKMANRVIRLRSGRIASIRHNLTPVPAVELVW